MPSPMNSYNPWVVLASLSFAVVVGCGGTPPPQPQPPAPSGGSAKDLTDTPSSGGNKARTDESTQALLDSLLATGASGGTTRRVAPPAEPGPPPAQRPPPSPAGGGSDTFDADTARIRGTVAGWDDGTGINVRFLHEATGEHLSLVFVDPSRPSFNAKNKLWVIQAKAKSNEQVLGHFMILLRDVSPGKYEGSSTKTDVVVASLLTSGAWDGNQADAAWSLNEGGWAEVVLRASAKPGHLEGTFRAKLVANSKQSFQTIESGYIYINPGT